MRIRRDPAEIEYLPTPNISLARVLSDCSDQKRFFAPGTSTPYTTTRTSTTTMIMMTTANGGRGGIQSRRSKSTLGRCVGSYAGTTITIIPWRRPASIPWPTAAPVTARATVSTPACSRRFLAGLRFHSARAVFAASTPSTSCPSGCTLTNAVAASCGGTHSDGSTDCTALTADVASCSEVGCTLTNATAETCVDTATDCSSGYTAGDAATPSTSCPSGCTLTPATGGHSWATACRRLLAVLVDSHRRRCVCSGGMERGLGRGALWQLPKLRMPDRAGA